jgi:hypothetical protein
MLEIKVNKMSGVQFYVNSGKTTASKAANESMLSTYTSTSVSLNPNMTYYIVVVAVDAVGTLNFTYRYYPLVAKCLDT